MAVTCPECKATLDDPSKPCEWCGHAAALEEMLPSEAAATAPPPPDYAAQARPPVVVIPPNDGPPRPTKPVLRNTVARTPEPFATPDDLSAIAPEPFTSSKAPRPIPKEPEPLTTAPPPPRPPSLPPSAIGLETPVHAVPSVRKTREQILDGDNVENPISLEVDMIARAPSVSARVAAIAVPIMRGPMPTGPDLDPVEVRMVARFGAAPESWWTTPSYVRHVRARQTELVAEKTAAEDQYFAAKGALDDALVSIGQRAIAEVRNTSKARGSFLKTLDRLAKREAELKAVDPAAIEESERQREQLLSLYERIEMAKVKLASAKTKELTAELASLQQERDAAERAARTPAMARDPEVERARGAFRLTCADFAQMVLDDRTAFGEEYEEPRARVARLRNACDAAEKKVLLHRAARDAFDEKALATGLRVMYGAIGLAVLSLVVLVLALK